MKRNKLPSLMREREFIEILLKSLLGTGNGSVPLEPPACTGLPWTMPPICGAASAMAVTFITKRGIVERRSHRSDR
jgi:hypothetical protein